MHLTIELRNRGFATANFMYSLQVILGVIAQRRPTRVEFGLTMEATPQQHARTDLGPLSFENWRLYELGDHSGETLEFPLFTDAYLTGESTFGPYQILNAIAGRDHDGRWPAAYLRIALATELPQTDLTVTNDERHHGGTFENEIAALVSLAFGCRLYAGLATRWFRPGDDPKGRPWSFADHQRSQPILLQTRRGGVVLPNARSERNLGSESSIAQFASLPGRDAIAVIRVARLYQDAMWISESQPEMSWLLLVSAIETAAGHRDLNDESVSERVRAWRPALAELLEQAGGQDLLEDVSEIIAPLSGATTRFVRFLVDMAPTPPATRPPEFAQIGWARGRRKALFSTIYDYRSRALHDGKPFPSPMCDAPHEFDGVFCETPIGLANGAYGAAWRVEDTPLLLHTFEYIARQALLSWWSSLAPAPAEDAG